MLTNRCQNVLPNCQFFIPTLEEHCFLFWDSRIKADRDSGQVACASIVGEAPFCGFWGAGERDCVLSRTRLGAAVQKYHPGHDEEHWLWKKGALKGVRAAGDVIEQQEDSSFLVSDPCLPGNLPKLPAQHRICAQMHPGLCRSRDASVYDAVPWVF